MPSGDRTGPSGNGPRTGRSAGYCSGYETAGFENPVPRRGGGGRGRRGGRGIFGFRNLGRGQGRGFFQSGFGGVSEAEEAQILNNEAGFLKKRLENISQRLQELNKE